LEETVLLDVTSCTYGGKRYWFRCPTCNRPAITLFVVGPPFGCRVCMARLRESAGIRLGRDSQARLACFERHRIHIRLLGFAMRILKTLTSMKISRKASSMQSMQILGIGDGVHRGCADLRDCFHSIGRSSTLCRSVRARRRASATICHQSSSKARRRIRAATSSRSAWSSTRC
jgi:hypothetical protein